MTDWVAQWVATWDQRDAKKDFRDKFETYAGVGAANYPNVYWNPRTKGWGAFTGWRIEDRGLPTAKTTMGSFQFGNADKVYDELTAQYPNFNTKDKAEAVWDPRRLKWIAAIWTGTVTEPVNKHAEFVKRYRELVSLHGRHVLDDRAFQERVADLLEEFPPT